MAGLKISEEEIRRSIIGTIGDVDAYLLPDAKGFTSLVHYLTGYRQEDRQAMREQILSAQASDFTSLAELLERSARNSLSAALTSDTEADSLQTLRTEGSVRIKAL